jgi:hypothetical protein
LNASVIANLLKLNFLDLSFNKINLIDSIVSAV